MTNFLINYDMAKILSKENIKNIIIILDGLIEILINLH